MQVYGKLKDDKIEYAPINFKTEDGQIIINFNTNETLMKENGFKIIEDTACPDFNRDYEIVKCKWEETEDKIVKVWTKQTDLEKLGNHIINKINEWFERKQEELIEVDSYYIKTSWFGTYTNVYCGLKFAEENGILVEPSQVIVATEDNKFINIEVSSSEELKPLYEAAMLKYRELISKRNELLVSAQNADSLDELMEIIQQI